MRVGAIGPKLDGHGTEDAELACHLVHSTQGPLLISVCKFDHQAGRGTLWAHMQFTRLMKYVTKACKTILLKMCITSIHSNGTVSCKSTQLIEWFSDSVMSKQQTSGYFIEIYSTDQQKAMEEK